MEPEREHGAAAGISLSARESTAISHRELALAALLWGLFGALNAFAGHGPIAFSIHAVAAIATLGCAGLAYAGRPTLAFHLGTTIWLVATSAYCVGSGALNDGVLTLVLIPVLATYVDSARAGLVWLAVVAASLLSVRALIAGELVPRLFEITPSLREPVLVSIAAVMWLFAERSRRRSDRAIEGMRKSTEEARARADDLARLKRMLEEKNTSLDALAERLAESASEITESNLALEEARDAALRQAKEAVDFLTRMSHEIRTPLNGVLGITDVLLGSKLDREARELVRILESSGRLLRRIVDEVLDLARLDAGKLPLVDEVFDPLTVAEDVADLFAAQAGAKGVLLVTVPPESILPRLLGDAMRVRQVLQNLVGNAVKFTPRGHVRIDVALERTTLVYRVEDTGPGLGEEALASLFTEYTQARDGSRRGGSGLGLVIARRLARAMGGDVEVSSRLGVGSTFVARFSLARASTGRQSTQAEGELSGAITAAGLICSDPLLSLALARTAALVNVQLDAIDPASLLAQARGTRSGIALVLADGAATLPDVETPVVRLRAPATELAGDESGLALLLPPRRARLLRALRQARGERREQTMSGRVAPPNGLSALVVDDELVNRKVAALLLSREGWSVRSASSGQEALELQARDPRIDAVLVDLDMPELDGIATARLLGEQAPPGLRPWLVLQTASIDEQARVRARQVGVLDFLPKPFEVEQLRDVMLRAARYRRLEERRAQLAIVRPRHDPATHGAVSLLVAVGEAILFGEADVALAQLGELQALARRRQLDRIDRCCSALHDALLESEGLEALADLEAAVWAYSREATTDHGERQDHEALDASA